MTEKRTALHAEHVAAKAHMSNFAGWDMPLHYGSQIAEHHAVRRAAGLFDVSHMTIIDIHGAGARSLLTRVFAGDVDKTAQDRAVYGVLLNGDAGVIDDVIVYGLEAGYRVVSNASTRDKVLDWLRVHADLDTRLEERADLAMIAVQGPDALALFERVATGAPAAELAPFAAVEWRDWMIARTGYTGEDGLEAMLPAAAARQLWRNLVGCGAAPAGLAARDTLRLEAGLNLYGQDMDDETSPLEANLGWTVAWQPAERLFVGREALARQRAAKPDHVLRGLVMEGRGVLRRGNDVVTDRGAGVVTSGTFSPTLGYSIALVRIPRGASGSCRVRMRGRDAAARIVKPPFVRRGKRVFE